MNSISLPKKCMVFGGIIFWDPMKVPAVNLKTEKTTGCHEFFLSFLEYHNADSAVVPMPKEFLGEALQVELEKCLPLNVLRATGVRANRRT